MTHPLHIKARRAVRNIFRNVTGSRKHKKIITDFAEKYGLIYFGSVDQHSDDHQYIRGFTSSPSHLDNHYTVGTVSDYDVKLVDRNDAVWLSDGSVGIFNWLILTVGLHNGQDIPHFFIRANRRISDAYDSLFTAYPNMNEVHMGTFEDYNSDFSGRFTVYSQPTDSIEIERLIPSDTARVFGAHFWPLSVECLDGTLYLYADGKRITPHLLNALIEDGLWLARHLDNQIVNI